MDNVILLCEYGSRAHGTDTEFSDHDKMGIYVEPIDAVLGINSVDTVQKSTAAKGARSTKDDTDTTYYPLRKWASLAAHGNPTVLTPLFIPSFAHEIQNEYMWRIIGNRDLFISKEAGNRFLGYMRSQRDALTGKRNKKTNRPELIHTHGFDTKFAYHMIRLGVLGIELMETGKMTLPMVDTDAAYLLDIRNGKFTKNEVLRVVELLDAILVNGIKNSDLPDKPDVDGINNLLISIQTDYWGLGGIYGV